MLEQEFEPRCASTSYTRPIFSKGKFSKLVPSHCLEAISTHVDLFYRSPPSVSAAPKQWNQRMVSREQSPGKCQRALESCWERGVPATLLPTSTSLSLQVKAAESGQLTRRPHKLLRCKGSIFPTGQVWISHCLDPRASHGWQETIPSVVFSLWPVALLATTHLCFSLRLILTALVQG